ncbi:MAG: SURF1 family protein, partial [Gemmatimonadota bacterium]
MSASSRRWLPLLLGVLLALPFGRLGIWQLSRLSERRELNRARETAAAEPVVRLGQDRRPLPPADSLLWRRATATGSWDAEREIVVRGRSWLGSPGVAVLTPLRPGSGEAILVLRGWLPAADGLSADLERARTGTGDAGGAPSHRSVSVSGLVVPGEGTAPLPPRELSYPVGRRVVLGSVDLAAADSLLPYPVAPFVLQVLPDPARAPRPGDAERPRPFSAPQLTDGPHLFYAFQWFGFAAIALAAGVLLPRAARPGRRPPEPPAPSPGRDGKSGAARPEARQGGTMSRRTW